MPAHRVPLDTDQIIALYREGWTCSQIAIHQGVGLTTVWRRLVAAGEARRRPNSERVA